MADLREKVIKPVKGYEGYYEVDNTGKVFSVEREIIVNGKSGQYKSHVRSKELSQHMHTNGYMMVNLTKNGEGKSVRVHRLVADAFLENKDNLPLVNHKDEDKTNNCVENLEWCTPKYNLMYNGANKRAGDKKRGKRLSEEHKKKISDGVKKYFASNESILKGKTRIKDGEKFKWLI